MSNKKDNSHPDVKRLLRREALKRLENPVVLETHGGEGELRRACYYGLPGLICEKDPVKVAKLARDFPSTAVYQGDSLRLLRSGDLGMEFNLLDIDAYGDPWPHIDHVLHSNCVADRAVLVVTDGLIQGVRLGGSWTKGSLSVAVERLGNDLFKRYREAASILFETLCAPAGWNWQWLAFRWYPNTCYYSVELNRVQPATEGPSLHNRRSDKRADPFYSSALWKAVRARAITKANGKCAACGASDRVLHVDHIVARNNGGADYAKWTLRSLGTKLPVPLRPSAWAPGRALEDHLGTGARPRTCRLRDRARRPFRLRTRCFA